MKTEKKTTNGRLEYFQGLYENAKNAHAQERERFVRNMNQYKGSYELDGSSERAGTVRNITYEIIESQISSDIPLPKVDAACYNERRDRNAQNIEHLLSAVRDRLPYERMNDIDERYTYIYGSSVWYVEWNTERRSAGEMGEVEIHCISPKDFIGEPCVEHIEDMDYCFLHFCTTRAELVHKYGISDAESDMCECECERGDGSQNDAVSLIVCFYRDDGGRVGKFVFSGECVLLDIPNYYSRKRRVCAYCQRSLELCTCEQGERRRKSKQKFTSRDIKTEDDEYEYLDTDIYLYDETVIPAHDFDKNERTRIPYYVPHLFPIVIRKNISDEGRLFGQSDCEYIRPQQQAINKVESRILQKLLRSGITPIMPEDATVTLNNSVFGQVIKMRPGESAQQYGKVDTTPDISQDILEAERLYDQARRLIGISDALVGLDTNKNESGYSRQLKISQASGRLESKRKMKHTAYSELDRLIFMHYLAFADEPRALSYKDAYGRVHDAQFSRYDFVEYDLESGAYFYDDSYLFSVDLNGGAQYQREALWERNLENLKAGTLGDAGDPATLLRYWQAQERAHYPYARENVEYFRQSVDMACAAPYQANAQLASQGKAGVKEVL